MKRIDQRKLNQRVIERIKKIERSHQLRIPSYQSVITIINMEGLRTSRGNTWTRRSLYRMLQRNGISGLYGLYKCSI